MQKAISKIQSISWLDVVNPSTEELEKLAQTHNLHPLQVQDCMEPEHLPKLEKNRENLFLIMRLYDANAPIDGASVQEMTRKLAIFVRDNFMLTIHRAPLSFHEDICEEIEKNTTGEEMNITTFLILLARECVLTFEAPLIQAEKKLDQIEHHVGQGLQPRSDLYQLHLVRRRLANLKRLLWHTSTIVQRLTVNDDQGRIMLTDLKETVESLMFFADELLDDANSLINLEMSTSTQKNNEVIRILTLFSVFFMPLTFIVGVYGMNFKAMPELEWAFGYGFSWLLMLSVTALIAFWFRKKGFFNRM